MSYALPGLYEGLVVLLFSASIGWVVGYLVAPLIFDNFDPMLSNYFGFVMAASVVFISRMYIGKRMKGKTRYR
jgi:hypothetical protein